MLWSYHITTLQNYVIEMNFSKKIILKFRFTSVKPFYFQWNEVLCLENQLDDFISHNLQYTFVKVKQGITIWVKTANTLHDICQVPLNKSIPSQILFTKPNCLNSTTQFPLPSSEWTICSAYVCVCMCLHLLAKFVPLFGGILRVSELQQATGHSESIPFD